MSCPLHRKHGKRKWKRGPTPCTVTNSEGQVFKILWSEPQGQPLPNPQTLARIESCTEKLQIEDARGMFYVGIRRFIVIAVDQGNCTCVYVFDFNRTRRT